MAFVNQRCSDAGARDRQRAVPGQPFTADRPRSQRGTCGDSTAADRRRGHAAPDRYGSTTAPGHSTGHAPCCTGGNPGCADHPCRHAHRDPRGRASGGAGAPRCTPRRPRGLVRFNVGCGKSAERTPDAPTDRPAKSRQQATSSPRHPRSALLQLVLGFYTPRLCRYSPCQWRRPPSFPRNTDNPMQTFCCCCQVPKQPVCLEREIRWPSLINRCTFCARNAEAVCAVQLRWTRTRSAEASTTRRSRISRATSHGTPRPAPPRGPASATPTPGTGRCALGPNLNCSKVLLQGSLFPRHCLFCPSTAISTTVLLLDRDTDGLAGCQC